MDRSTQVIGASVLVGTLVALVWLQAPILPAVLGAAGAGFLLFRRSRRVTT